MKTVIKFFFFVILLSFTINVYSEDTSTENKLIINTQHKEFTIIFIPIQNKEISFINENGLQWYDNGMIKSGTLKNATQLFFTSNKDKLWFKTRTNVIFDNNGLITSGTLVDGRHIESKEVILLKKNTVFKIPGGSELEFKKNSGIIKNQKNEVIYGTLTGDQKFRNMTSGRDIWFKKDHPLLIDSKGNIREGVLLKNTELMMILHERYIWMKKDFSVLLDQEGRIRSGTLLEPAYVQTNGGVFLWAAGDSVIIFNEDGYAL